VTASQSPPIRADTPRSARLWPGDGLALAVGASLPLAFAPYGWYWIAVLAPAILFLLWREVTPRRALWRGWLFGLGLFGAGTSWVHISINQFGGVGLPLAVLATALFVAAMALFPAVLGYLATRLFAGPRPLALLVVLPACWTLLEWVRGWFLTGFPWLNLGYSQIDTPLAGLAPVLGVYGVSLLVALSAGLLAAFIELGGVRRRIALLGGILGVWLCGWGLGQLQWVEPAGDPLRASLVQGNVAQDLKWLDIYQQPTLELYRELTRASWGSDLIVWPETAVPAFYHQTAGYLHELAEEGRAHGSELVVGVPVLDLVTGRYYNGLMSLGEEPGLYAKRHLVPFGEYLPLRTVLGHVLDFIEIPMSDFTPGDADQTTLRAAGLTIGASICYEAAFGEELIDALPQAELLINVSNDGWFGDSLAPHQHLQIARMRALETGRYLLRATNTGISAIIGPDGALLATSPQFEVHVLTGELRPMRGATPYVRLGNAPVVLVLLLGLGSLAVVTARRQKALLTET
jgi:apolipoprotein N-acyltransferase